VRKLLLLESILLLSIMSLEPAYAAIKAGEKCQKISATQIVGNLKLTCIKSGFKLIWSRGVALSPSSPSTPISNSTLAPDAQAKPNPFDSTPFPDLIHEGSNGRGSSE
jgi:hypothetical protein